MKRRRGRPDRSCDADVERRACKSAHVWEEHFRGHDRGDWPLGASLLRLEAHQEVGVCFHCVGVLAKRKQALQQ
jgi:hypothetical protein